MRFLIDRWADRRDVPKKVAMAFLDLSADMKLSWDYYSEEQHDEIEDASIELADLARALLSEPEAG